MDGAQTVTFGYEGYDYSLDLCKEHSDDFHNTVQGLISWSSDRTRSGAARRGRRPASVDEASSSAGGASSSNRSSADRERLKAIREWARQNGSPDLGDRGRIPQAIVAAYDAAH